MNQHSDKCREVNAFRGETDTGLLCHADCPVGKARTVAALARVQAAQLAAGAPEVRRRLTPADLFPVPPAADLRRHLLAAGYSRPAVEEVVRRLLAFPGLLAALEEVEPLLARLGSQGGLAAVRAALAAART